MNFVDIFFCYEGDALTRKTVFGEITPTKKSIRLRRVNFKSA